MWDDPVVKETRAAREELLERFHYDLDALCAYLLELEEQSEKKSVSLPPRPVAKSARKAS